MLSLVLALVLAQPTPYVDKLYGHTTPTLPACTNGALVYDTTLNYTKACVNGAYVAVACGGSFTGVLTVPHGGTGLATMTGVGAIPTGGTAGTGTMVALQAVAAGQVLASAGTGTIPAYTATPTVTSLATGTETITSALSIGAPTQGTSGLGSITAKSAADVTLTGTTTVNNSVQVVGTGTLFLTELSVGDAIALSSASTIYIVVVAIADDTHCTLIQAVGNNTSNTTISKRPRALRLDTNAGVMELSSGGGGSNVGNLQLHDASLTQNKWAGTATLTQRRLDGTRALPTAVQSAETLATLVHGGFDGTTFGNAATFSSLAESTWTTSNHESSATISTVPNGSTTITARLKVRSDGLLSLSSAYTAGSILWQDASNVVQTNKPTTCTLNGGTPSTCTVTVPTGATACFCSMKGASAAIALLGCAWGLSGTTLTITSANAASNDVTGGCF